MHKALGFLACHFVCFSDSFEWSPLTTSISAAKNKQTDSFSWFGGRAWNSVGFPLLVHATNNSATCSTPEFLKSLL